MAAAVRRRAGPDACARPADARFPAGQERKEDVPLPFAQTPRFPDSCLVTQWQLEYFY